VVNLLCGDVKNAEYLDGRTNVQNVVSLDHRVKFMAQIVATIKIFPREITKDFNNLKDSINKVLPTNSYVHKFEEEPIAFGLVALIAHIVMAEDTGGEMEKVEEALKTINDIDEVEVLLVRRI